MGRAYIGTSGWSYRSWEGTFYPPRLPKTQQFDHYATHFPTVEINLTFYRLPTAAMVQTWAAKAPAGFKYAIKGSRFITHMKKLLKVEEALQVFFHALEPMRRHLAIVLWQLPPFLELDLARLEAFLRQLPRKYDYAVEFRHPSWLTTDTYRLLRQHGTAFVSVSSLAMPADFTVTTDTVYLRFHGLEAGAAHDYTADELLPWAEHASVQVRGGKRVFAYFNNDVNARAPENAKTFMGMLGACANHQRHSSGEDLDQERLH